MTGSPTDDAEAEIGWVIDLVTAIRSVRAEMNITVATELPLVLVGVSPETDARAGRWADVIKRLGAVSSMSVATSRAAGRGAARRARRGGGAAAQGRDRLRRRAGAARKGDGAASKSDIARIDAKLDNPNSSPTRAEEVVEGEREKREEAEGRRAEDHRGAGAAQGRACVFVAGASGVVGQRLLPLLRQDGHQVVATTRSPAKAEALRALGATPVVVDVFDKPALERAVVAAKPDVIIHQLADLPEVLDPAQMDAVLASNARLRRDGTRNLMAAAQAAASSASLRRALSGFMPRVRALVETDPLDTAEGDRQGQRRWCDRLGTGGAQHAWCRRLVLRYG